MTRIALTSAQITTIVEALDLLAEDQQQSLDTATLAFGPDHHYTRRLATCLDDTWATAALIAVQTNTTADPGHCQQRPLTRLPNCSTRPRTSRP